MPQIVRIFGMIESETPLINIEKIEFYKYSGKSSPNMRKCMKVGGLKLPVATSTTQVLSLIQTNNRKNSTPRNSVNLLIILSSSSNQADHIYKIGIFI